MDADAPLDGLRVLHLSTVHIVTDPRIRLKECPTLIEAGATVRFVGRASAIEVENGVDVRTLPEYERRFDRVWKGQRDALLATRQFEPDVIHFHDPELLLIAPLLRRIAPVVIYDVHESLPDLVLDREWIPGWARKAVGRLCGFLEPLFARACSAYVFVDARWAPRFAERPWIELRNPPLADEFVPVERSVPPDPPHFVYVGELLPERGVHSAVRAVTAMETDTRLTLAGPCPPALADELQALDTKGRMSLPGLIDRPTVGDLLANATAGLVLFEPVPAYDGAIATKIHEYLGAGLPLVLSETTAHRRIADETGAAIVVPYDDIGALRSAMSTLTADEGCRTALVAAASEAAARATTWRDVQSSLIDLYRQIHQIARTAS